MERTVMDDVPVNISMYNKWNLYNMNILANTTNTVDNTDAAITLSSIGSIYSKKSFAVLLSSLLLSLLVDTDVKNMIIFCTTFDINLWIFNCNPLTTPMEQKNATNTRRGKWNDNGINFNFNNNNHILSKNLDIFWTI